MGQESGKQIRQYVNYRLASLIQMGNQPMFPAYMANLRRGVGTEPGSLPELWQFMFEDFPHSLAGQGMTPSAGERAVHAALTLFALHQQSKDINEKCMHVLNMPLGKAVQRLIHAKQEREEAIKRRFATVVTANSFEELVWHLRGLIKLLRDEDIPLDYAQLANDLFYFQFATARDGVRLQWGRQLYFASNEESSA